MRGIPFLRRTIISIRRRRGEFVGGSRCMRSRRVIGTTSGAFAAPRPPDCDKTTAAGTDVTIAQDAFGVERGVSLSDL